MLGIEITHQQLQYIMAAIIASMMLLLVGYSHELDREYIDKHPNEKLDDKWPK